MQGWARWWKHFRINHLYCTAQIMLPGSWTTWGTMTLQHTEARCLSFQLVFVYQASSWFLRSFHRFFYWLDLLGVQFILFCCVKKPHKSTSWFPDLYKGRTLLIDIHAQMTRVWGAALHCFCIMVATPFRWTVLKVVVNQEHNDSNKKHNESNEMFIYFLFNT